MIGRVAFLYMAREIQHIVVGASARVVTAAEPGKITNVQCH